MVFLNGLINVHLAPQMKNVLLFQASRPTVSKVNRHQSELKKNSYSFTKNLKI